MTNIKKSCIILLVPLLLLAVFFRLVEVISFTEHGFGTSINIIFLLLIIFPIISSIYSFKEIFSVSDNKISKILGGLIILFSIIFEIIFIIVILVPKNT